MKALGDRLDRVGRREQIQQLERADDRLKRVGSTATRAAAEMNKTGRATSTVDRAMSNVRRSTDAAGSSLGRASNSMRRASREAESLGDRVRKLGALFASIGKLAVPAKFAAIGIAVGVALQGVNALAAGVVALAPRLVDLTGVLAALPATIGGLGLAMVTFKLATNDLSKALGGNKDALKGLTPEARQFVGTLKDAQGTVKDLRRAAQGGLFPGLDAAITRLQRGAPMAERLLARMGTTLGQEAARWARAFTTDGMLRDLESLGTQGTLIFSRISRGVLNLGKAVVDVARAAEPFTEWLTKGLLSMTKWVAASAHAGRANGQLRGFFLRTQDALVLFGHTLGRLWVTMRNVGHAARPLGDDLYRSFDRAATRWADWTGSMQGQNYLAQYFADARAPLHEFFGLIGDLLKAIATFDPQPLAATLHALRGVVPDLQRAFETMAQYGPALARGIGQAADLLANLVNGAGPLTLIVGALTNALSLVNTLIDRIPAFGTMLSAGVVVVGLNALRGRLAGLAGAWGLVAANATAAAAAEQAASGVTGGGSVLGSGAPAGGGTGGGTPVGGAVNTSRPGAEGTRSTFLGVPYGAAGRDPARLTLRDRYQRFQYARNPNPRSVYKGGGIRGNLAGLGAALALGGGAGGLRGAAAGARGLAAGAARFVAPLALIGGVLGAAQGTGGRGVSGLAANTLSGLSFGLTPNTAKMDAAQQQREIKGAGTEGQAINRALGRAGGTTPHSQGQVNNQIRILQTEVESRKDAVGAEGELREQLQGQLDARKELLTQMKTQARAARDMLDLDKVNAFGASLDKAFDIRAKTFGADRAMDQMSSRLLTNMRGLGRRGAAQMASNTLQWARAQAKNNPKLWGEVHRLEDRIRASFKRTGNQAVVVNGQIYSSSKTAWKSIADTMISEAQRGEIATGKSFDKVYAKAISALQDLGFTPSVARQLIKAQNAGGARAGRASFAASNPTAPASTTSGFTQDRPHAQGGRIAGFGLRDTVPIAPGNVAAPGELVVNRHTEDRVRRRYGVDLGSEVAGETRKHSDPQPYAGIMPGLAHGGRVFFYATGDRLGRGAQVQRERAAGNQGTVAGGSVTATTAATGGGGTGNLASMQARAEQITAGHYPYRWGGGHDPGITPPYDCSGAVSSVLHAGGFGNLPQVAASFASWGTPGAGGPVVVYSKPTHTFMSINGRGFGTGSSNPGGGAGWLPYSSRPGFTARSIPVDGSATGMAAATGAMGVTGLTVPTLTAPTSGVAGIPGVLADRASDVITQGANARLQAIAQTATAQATPSTGNATAGGAYDKNALMGLWTQAGGDPGVANLMAAIALAESNGNPSAHNPSGASGLWQILGNPFAGNAMDPLTNARMAVSKYQSQGLGAWEAYTRGMHTKYLATGGRVMQRPDWGGWFGEGGSITASRPTMIGLGERGTETATVVKGRGGSGGVRIENMTIHNRRPGDIRKQVKAEVEQAFRELATEIDGLGMEREEDLA